MSTRSVEILPKVKTQKLHTSFKRFRNYFKEPGSFTFPKRGRLRQNDSANTLFIYKVRMELNVTLFFHKNSVSQAQVGIFLFLEYSYFSVSLRPKYSYDHS